MKNALIALALAVLAPVAASAQDSPEECAASFSARLADARNAIRLHQAYMAEHDRVMPWFGAHCRMLSEEEIVARRIDDPMAFVCDTQRGRPRGLDGRFLAQYAVAVDIPSFQEMNAENLRCQEHDARERVSLVLYRAVQRTDEAVLAETIRRLEVLCFEVASPRCDSARENIARARAGAAPAAPATP